MPEILMVKVIETKRKPPMWAVKVWRLLQGELHGDRPRAGDHIRGDAWLELRTGREAGQKARASAPGVSLRIKSDRKCRMRAIIRIYRNVRHTFGKTFRDG